MSHAKYLVEPGQKVRLSHIDADDTGQFKDKQEAKHETEKNLARLSDLQEVLYADAKHSVLIVLQAMDAAGKDGTIKHIFSGVNPQGCSVTSFKAPSTLELAHDYLWRIHEAAPPHGMIGIFNRSHYESVLVERVKKLVPKETWSKRYEQINDFERMLSAEGTTIIKVFLHISKAEQAKRLQARLDDPAKHWKFDPLDLKVREQWDDYQTAYEDAIEKCSTKAAPWYVIPANHKWFRNWVVSQVMVKTLSSLHLQFPPPAPGIGKLRVV